MCGTVALTCCALSRPPSKALLLLGHSIHEDQLTALGAGEAGPSCFQTFPPHKFGLGHCSIAAGTFDLLHEDQVLSTGPHVEGNRGTRSRLEAPTPSSPPPTNRALEEESNLAGQLTVDRALQHSEHLEADKVERLVGVCPRHHGSLKDNWGEQNPVLNKQPPHVVNVAGVERPPCGQPLLFHLASVGWSFPTKAVFPRPRL